MTQDRMRTFFLLSDFAVSGGVWYVGMLGLAVEPTEVFQEIQQFASQSKSRSRTNEPLRPMLFCDGCFVLRACVGGCW